MSSLIFYTDEHNAIVATDTLAVTPSGDPLTFCSKALYLPHLKVIIAGTGIGGFASRWALQVNEEMVLSGLDNLDFHTPEGLRRLKQDFIDDYPECSETTTTIYQFGYSEKDGKIESFAYRSTNDFLSEKLKYGLALKPECSFPEGDYSVLEVIPSLMKEQREIQERRPKQNRVYIGGQINVLHLNQNICTSFCLGEFEDFQQSLLYAKNQCR